jgi:hypothetical protein
MLPRRAADTAAQARDERVVRRRAHRREAVVTLVRHHHGSREAITDGRALAGGLALAEPVGELGLDGQVSGRQVGGPWLVGADVGVVGADDVGSLVVGSLEVGAEDVVRVLLGGGGGAVVGAWPVSGGVPVTLAAGGNCTTGTPWRSCFITAAQVAVG